MICILISLALVYIRCQEVLQPYRYIIIIIIIKAQICMQKYCWICIYLRTQYMQKKFVTQHSFIYIANAFLRRKAQQHIFKISKKQCLQVTTLQCLYNCCCLFFRLIFHTFFNLRTSWIFQLLANSRSIYPQINLSSIF